MIKISKILLNMRKFHCATLSDQIFNMHTHFIHLLKFYEHTKNRSTAQRFKLGVSGVLVIQIYFNIIMYST